MKGTRFLDIRTTLAVCILALALVVETIFIPIASAAKPERYCVVFEKAARKAVKDAIKAQFGDVIKKELKLVDVVAVVLPSPEDAEKLAKIPGVKSVVPDEVYIDPAGKPPKPAGEKLSWGVNRIDADMVWDRNSDMVVDSGANTGSGIKVAIVDSGIDLDHPDLAANIIGGINTIDGQDPNIPDDQNGHGTMIAGVIAAIDNSVGFIGVGPGISLYAVKITVKFDLSDLTSTRGRKFLTPFSIKGLPLNEVKGLATD